jgi:hypothetical protein
VRESPTSFDNRSRDPVAELVVTVLVPKSRSCIEQLDQQLGDVLDKLIDQYGPEERGALNRGMKQWKWKSKKLRSGLDLMRRKTHHEELVTPPPCAKIERCGRVTRKVEWYDQQFRKESRSSIEWF